MQDGNLPQAGSPEFNPEAGFDPGWLALREPADHAARHQGVLAEVVAHLAGLEDPLLLDIGSGTGSNLRGLAPRLGPAQRWILADHDPRLLAAAGERLRAWADAVEEPFLLRKSGSGIAVTFRRLDLMAEPPPLDPLPDLVTAAAFFDLASAAWIDGFVARLAERGAAFHSVLDYCGPTQWDGRHPADAEVAAAFAAHQRRDKGFGPALGPDAAAHLADAFRRRGYALEEGDSVWRLPAGPLSAALAEGWAGAVGETGLVAPRTLADWTIERARSGVTVRHRDLFARR